MIVSISGTQGSGKTTVLNMFETKHKDNPFIEVDDLKVSRTVMKELNIKSLDDMYSDPTRFMEFQNIIADKKFEHEQSINSDDKIILVDRSYVDMMAYATTIIGPYPSMSAVLDEYIDKLVKYQHLHDFSIIVKKLPFVEIEDDNVRSTSKPFQLLIELLINNMFITHSLDYDVMYETDRHERIFELENILKDWYYGSSFVII
jgi:predicted ATPase